MGLWEVGQCVGSEGGGVRNQKGEGRGGGGRRAGEGQVWVLGEGAQAKSTHWRLRNPCSKVRE